MITARQVFDSLLLIPTRTDGVKTLAPMVLHPAQRALLEAYDATDAAGAPLHDELAALWLKKTGKSETCGGLAIADLIGNSTEPDREVIIVSGDLAQSQSLSFASACRFVRRNEWLNKRCRVLKLEIVYSEEVTDQRTGGTHVEEHILRAVPADPKTNHGGRQTLTIFDEFWVHDAARGYDLIEALARAPTRKHPRILYASYAGLKSQAQAGYPLWDLWQRWKSGPDPRLFVSFLGGEEGWRSVPWITDAFIASQRRQFEHVPSKFKRLWLNEWASGDAGSFLTTPEIQDAIDPTLTEADGKIVGGVAGLDLGLSKDKTGFVVLNLDDQQRLVVQAVRVWRGTPSKPVSLMAVEEEVSTVMRRLGVRRIRIDRWNAAMLGERLTRRGFQVELATSDVSSLDRWASRLKDWFSGRTIRIPQHTELLDQLEGLEAEEMRRRDRVRFTATGAQHDDLAIALCLAGEPHAAYVGRQRFAEMPNGCHIEASGELVQCPIAGEAASLLAGCKRCPGYLSMVGPYERHLASPDGEWMDVATFAVQMMVPQPMDFETPHARQF